MTTTRKSLKELVDVTGIEPVTPCLQNSPTSSCNPDNFNRSTEKSRLESTGKVWPDVCKYGCLRVGSLQKSLHSPLTSCPVIQ
jgi:hypothetical protein